MVSEKGYSLVRRTGYLTSVVVYRGKTRQECTGYLESLLLCNPKMRRADYNILPFLKEWSFGDGKYGL